MTHWKQIAGPTFQGIEFETDYLNNCFKLPGVLISAWYPEGFFLSLLGS